MSDSTDTIQLTPPRAAAPDDNGAEPASATSARSAARGGSRFGVTPDQLENVCAGQPDDIVNELTWAFEFGHTQDMSVEEFAALLFKNGKDRYSPDAVYHLFGGNRDAGSVRRMCKAIAELRFRTRERAVSHSGGYVHTQLATDLFGVFQRCWDNHRIGFIIGPSQRGKSAIAEEFASRNPRGVVYLRFRTGGGYRDLLNAFYFRMALGAPEGLSAMRDQIFRSVKRDHMVIADEVHAPMVATRGTSRLISLELLRELHEETHCGMVMIGTEVFGHGLRANGVLRQLFLRGYRPYRVPEMPDAGDLALLAERFKLPPITDKVITVRNTDKVVIAQANPLELQTRIARDYGLTRWCSILDDAFKDAKRERKEMTWGRVILEAQKWDVDEKG